MSKRVKTVVKPNPHAPTIGATKVSNEEKPYEAISSDRLFRLIELDDVSFNVQRASLSTLGHPEWNTIYIFHDLKTAKANFELVSGERAP